MLPEGGISCITSFIPMLLAERPTERITTLIHIQILSLACGSAQLDLFEDRSEVIILFSCSSQLSMKFHLVIKISTIKTFF